VRVELTGRGRRSVLLTNLSAEPVDVTVAEDDARLRPLLLDVAGGAETPKGTVGGRMRLAGYGYAWFDVEGRDA
jgi:hypothetical protein